MTHTQAILRELALHGKTTYHDLMRQYEPEGHTYAGFVAAVQLLVRKGLVSPRDRHKRGPIVIAGCCPCCGRAMEDRR